MPPKPKSKRSKSVTWALEGDAPGATEKPKATIQIEVIHTARDCENKRTEFVYVTTDNIAEDTDGRHVARLSDLLPKAGSQSTPIKSQRTKLYRYDAVSKALTVLGRGNVVTDPGQNLDLAGNSILNDHRLTLNKAAGGQTFYSGIRLFSVADTMGAVEPPAPILLDSLTTNESVAPQPQPMKEAIAPAPRDQSSTRPAETDDSGQPAPIYTPHPEAAPTASHPQPAAIHFPSMTPEKTALLRSATTRIEWLRILFELSERDLPGERDLRTAREALDCFKLVNNVKLVVKSSVFKLDISKTLSPRFGSSKVSDTELRDALGFKAYKWGQTTKRWSSGIQGAATVEAWAQDPDCHKAENKVLEARFAYLNELPFNSLKSVVLSDQSKDWPQ